MVSETFDPDAWRHVDAVGPFSDITYHRARAVPAVRIAIDRPAVRNAFRPETVDELLVAFEHAKQQADVAAVILTGNGPPPPMAGGRSPPAVTSRSAARPGTSMRVRTTAGPHGHARVGCTSSRCNGRSGSSRSR
jgi:1,4-Dihydroxy-2-naphthoate synthase (EC 4.1.3.36)